MLNKLIALSLLLRDASSQRIHTSEADISCANTPLGVHIYFSDCLQCKSEHSDGVFVGPAGREFYIFGRRSLSTEHEVYKNANN